MLNNEPVAIDQIVGGVPIEVASGKTNGQGKYSISFVPPATGSYQVTTAQIAKIENSTLNPVFGDLLSPAATSSVKITVHSAITKVTVRAQGGKALIFGTVSPGKSHTKKATVTMLAKPAGSTKAFKKVATDKLATNDANFAAQASLASGNWLIQVKYSDAKQVVAAPGARRQGVGQVQAEHERELQLGQGQEGLCDRLGQDQARRARERCEGPDPRYEDLRRIGAVRQQGDRQAQGRQNEVHRALQAQAEVALGAAHRERTRAGSLASDTGLKTINVK